MAPRILGQPLSGRSRADSDGSFIFEGYSKAVLIRMRTRNGEVGTIYPVQGDGVEEYFSDGNIPKPLLNSPQQSTLICMPTAYVETIPLEDVALALLRALRAVMSGEDRDRLLVDDMDTQQAPGLMLEIMEGLAKKYSPQLSSEYKLVIQEEFGYTF